MDPNDPTLPPNVHPFPPRPGSPGGPAFIPNEVPQLPDFMRMFGPGAQPGAAETPEQTAARKRVGAELESERLAARCAQELHNLREITSLACTTGAKISVQGITVDPPAPPTPLDRSLSNLVRNLSQFLQPDLRSMPLMAPAPAEDPVAKFMFAAAQAGLIDAQQFPEQREHARREAVAWYEVCKLSLTVGDPRWGQIAPIRVALEPRPATEAQEPQDAQGGPGSVQDEPTSRGT